MESRKHSFPGAGARVLSSLRARAGSRGPLNLLRSPPQRGVSSVAPRSTIRPGLFAIQGKHREAGYRGVVRLRLPGQGGRDNHGIAIYIHVRYSGQVLSHSKLIPDHGMKSGTCLWPNAGGSAGRLGRRSRGHSGLCDILDLCKTESSLQDSICVASARNRRGEVNWKGELVWPSE